MTQAQLDAVEAVRAAAPPDGAPQHMLPAAAYTSPEVLAWELRTLFAGSWTCLGRVADLRSAPDGGGELTQRSVAVGDVGALLVRSGARVRMFANTFPHPGQHTTPQ